MLKFETTYSAKAFNVLSKSRVEVLGMISQIFVYLTLETVPSSQIEIARHQTETFLLRNCYLNYYYKPINSNIIFNISSILIIYFSDLASRIFLRRYHSLSSPSSSSSSTMVLNVFYFLRR